MGLIELNILSRVYFMSFVVPRIILSICAAHLDISIFSSSEANIAYILLLLCNVVIECYEVKTWRVTFSNIIG